MINEICNLNNYNNFLYKLFSMNMDDNIFYWKKKYLTFSLFSDYSHLREDREAKLNMNE